MHTGPLCISQQSSPHREDPLYDTDLKSSPYYKQYRTDTKYSSDTNEYNHQKKEHLTTHSLDKVESETIFSVFTKDRCKLDDSLSLNRVTSANGGIMVPLLYICELKNHLLCCEYNKLFLLEI